MNRRSLGFRASGRLAHVTFGLVAVGTIAGLGLAFITLNSHARAGEPGYDHPCIVIWHNPNYPPPGKPMIWGLESAIWKDGSILIAAGERSNPGQDILVGKVDPKDVEAALKQIRDAEFFDGLTGRVPLDAGSTSIRVEYAGKAATVRFCVGLMPIGQAPDSHRALLRKWRRARGAIEAIAPIELAPLNEKIGEQKTFRGYNSNQPATTPWIPSAPP